MKSATEAVAPDTTPWRQIVWSPSRATLVDRLSTAPLAAQVST
jgi:hypothetical protein